MYMDNGNRDAFGRVAGVLRTGIRCSILVVVSESLEWKAATQAKSALKPAKGKGSKQEARENEEAGSSQNTGNGISQKLAKRTKIRRGGWESL